MQLGLVSGMILSLIRQMLFSIIEKFIFNQMDFRMVEKRVIPDGFLFENIREI